MLYFDHAASSPLCSEALETLHKHMKEEFANPSAAHKWGKELSKKTEEIRSDFLKRLGGQKGSRFIFTGSASESNNTLIKGLPLTEGDGLYVSKGDHASLVNPALFLEKKGVLVGELSLNEVGVPDASLLPDPIPENLKLILLSSVNSQSGGLLEVEKFAAEVKEKAPWVHLHVDAVQSFGKVPLDLSAGNIDSVTMSGHKMGGPKGVAALWIKEGIRLEPLIHGGNQEKDFRSSTIAFPLIASFHKAFEVADEKCKEDYKEATDLKKTIIDGLLKISKDFDFPFEDSGLCSPYILALIWKGISSDIVLRHLEQEDVAIASTSACSSKIKGENPTMTALGLPKAVHKYVLRISIGKSTSSSEVDEFINRFSKVYEELKPFVKAGS